MNNQHEAVAPISWLIGKWESISAEGNYPTIKPFKYSETIEFKSVGQPMLNYESNAYNIETKKPMHLERGFLYIKPSTNELSFQVAHNFGLTTVEGGIVIGNKINLKANQIGRMSFAKDPSVVALEREILLQENGTLQILVSMATTNTSLTNHLKVVYKKVDV